VPCPPEFFVAPTAFVSDGSAAQSYVPTVKGTTFDTGNVTIDPAAVSTKFWELYKNRADVVAQIS
jgi:hypothetical protein